MTSCFAPGCDSHYVRSSGQEEKVHSLFYPPKELFEEWKNAIPKSDKSFTMRHKLCELHFDEDCIERTFETRLPDGSVFTLEREKPRLKPGSIPTIFSNMPHPKPIKTNKRTYSSLYPFTQKTKKPKVADDEKGFIAVHKYKKLLSHLKDIIIPNKKWTIAPIQEYIICVKWNSKFHCERRVAVHKDLSVKIYLRNIQVNINAEVNDAESLSSLLRSVDNLVLCENIESKESNCLGYINDDEREKMCSSCRIELEDC